MKGNNGIKYAKFILMYKLKVIQLRDVLMNNP